MNTKRLLVSTKIARDLWEFRGNNFSQWVNIVGDNLEKYERVKQEQRARYQKELREVHTDDFDPKEMR